MNFKRAAASAAFISIGWSLALAGFSGAQGHHFGSLVEVVRGAIQRFADPSAATAAGYGPSLVCVSGPQEGAMGIHYVNGTLVGDGQLDPEKPEALMYEPKNGRLQLVGVEFIVLAQQWDCSAYGPADAAGSVVPLRRQSQSLPYSRLL